MPVLHEIGKRIVALRKQKGISQESLALSSDISVYYLHQIEHGFANPSILLLARLAVALGATLGDIIPMNLPSKDPFIASYTPAT